MSLKNALLLRNDGLSIPLRDDTVDLIVTSPPCGPDVGYDEGGVAPADVWPAFMATWLLEAYRVTKLNGRLALNVPMDTSLGDPGAGKSVMSRPIYARTVSAAESAGWRYHGTITWDKRYAKRGDRGFGSANSSARPHPVDPTELIVLFSKGAWAPSSDRPDDILLADWQEYSRGPWRFPALRQRASRHPAPFPEELPRRCIRLLSRLGDVVLDPFVGGGTTVVVAVTVGRRGIGCDRNAADLVRAARRVATVPFRRSDGKRCLTCNGLLTRSHGRRAYCSSACRQKAYRERSSMR